MSQKQEVGQYSRLEKEKAAVGVGSFYFETHLHVQCNKDWLIADHNKKWIDWVHFFHYQDEYPHTNDLKMLCSLLTEIPVLGF